MRRVIYILQNIVTISLATVAAFFLGGLIYPPARPDGSPAQTSVREIGIALLAEFWLCAILAGALILAPPKANGWVMALMTPLIIWIGFVAPVLTVTQRARALSWRAVGLDCGHWLLVMMVQAVILKSIGLTPPH